MDHELYMQRCFSLALLGAGRVAPNPMVGAVLVYDGRIIGEGYHRKYGEAHAEVNCIESVQEPDRDLIGKSTIYVSLEPCSHYGKTPPCADLIIAHKIPKVVIACRDSFAKVNGTGVQKLRDAGVEVIEHIIEDAALELNKRFFTFHALKRPYIILKWAQSNNGMIAGKDHQPLAISNAISNRLVHKWRAEEAAILVGTKTAMTDDPSLTTRLWPGNNPVRIVIDKKLSLPASSKLADGTVPTIVVNSIKEGEQGNTLFHQIAEGEDLPQVLLDLLYRRQLTSLIVEGGTKTLQSFIDAGLWDEARIITNESMEIAAGIAAPLLKGQQLIKEEHILADRIQYFTHQQIPAGS
ncbi:MAG: bifunctional diaminohydroxyphosphoribosylaminopyrimidine deaminase/5-amino-6-(5-phosphoribosylamino)uracil reductase RibD [Sphingobacteriales bacterium]|nr:MAG: bifunctional diaminohydroxyphosphoribosylaminopyrimidine deaminase/5-amino-6-(5-phosphoribosylamino)uracil reductase RibD [Sphingobacteriales bacterium]